MQQYHFHDVLDSLRILLLKHFTVHHHVEQPKLNPRNPDVRHVDSHQGHRTPPFREVPEIREVLLVQGHQSLRKELVQDPDNRPQLRATAQKIDPTQSTEFSFSHAPLDERTSPLAEGVHLHRQSILTSNFSLASNCHPFSGPTDSDVALCRWQKTSITSSLPPTKGVITN